MTGTLLKNTTLPIFIRFYYWWIVDKLRPIEMLYTYWVKPMWTVDPKQLKRHHMDSGNCAVSTHCRS